MKKNTTLLEIIFTDGIMKVALGLLSLHFLYILQQHYIERVMLIAGDRQNVG